MIDVDTFLTILGRVSDLHFGSAVCHTGILS